MASAWELKNSRDGTSSGGGAFAYPRIFRVRTNLPTDDPRITIQVIPKTSGGVPFGTAHPWDFSATAQTYTLIEKEAPLLSRVRIDYKLPEVLTPIQQPQEGLPAGWEYRAIGATISRPLTQEFFNPDSPSGPLRILGIPKYHVRTEGEPAAAYYTWKDADGATIRVDLTREYARVPFQEILDLPCVGVILSTVSSKYRINTTLSIADKHKKTNVSSFLGAAPGHVQFVDWSVQSRRLQTTNTGRIGQPIVQFTVVYDVQLHFLFSFEPLNRRTEIHTFDQGDGSFGLVHRTGGSLVEETFGIKESRELNDLFRLF